MFTRPGDTVGLYSTRLLSAGRGRAAHVKQLLPPSRTPGRHRRADKAVCHSTDTDIKFSDDVFYGTYFPFQSLVLLPAPARSALGATFLGF